MSRIFISYRREDSEGQARALSIELARYVSEDSVFLDVDSIALGRDFRKALHDRLETCDALLALIGPSWLDAKDGAGKRRLDDPGDYLRQEIALALVRNIPVTPVLVHGAAMPAQERLPDDLKEFAFRNGFELSHSRWHSDVRELAHRLGLDDAPVASSNASVRAAPLELAAAPSGVAAWTRRRALGAAAIAVAAAGLGVAATSVRRWLLRPPKPLLRSISFDYATVDQKATRLQSERVRRFRVHRSAVARRRPRNGRDPWWDVPDGLANLRARTPAQRGASAPGDCEPLLHRRWTYHPGAVVGHSDEAP